MGSRSNVALPRRASEGGLLPRYLWREGYFDDARSLALKYDLLECTLLFDRFHSQYTHELRDTCAHDPKRDVFGECRMPLGSNPPG